MDRSRAEVGGDCLLVDLGNTNASAATLAVGGEASVVPGGAQAVLARLAGDGSLAGLEAALAALIPGPRRVRVASVAAAARVAALQALLARAGLPAAEVNPDPGLHLALERPETCGHDRQYAARAALALGGEACVVVDAGTALTVDAVVPLGHPAAALALPGGGPPPVAAAGRAGVFLGGAIAPGPRLLAEALGRGGAGLWEVALDPDVSALGRHSDDAMRAGIVVGHAGAARELARRVLAEAGLEGARVWLTGGAARFVRAALLGEFGARLVERDDLVLLGLALAAEAAA